MFPFPLGLRLPPSMPMPPSTGQLASIFGSGSLATIHHAMLLERQRALLNSPKVETPASPTAGLPPPMSSTRNDRASAILGQPDIGTMKRVGSFNVYSAAVPCRVEVGGGKTSKRRTTEFHAVLYDGAKPLEAGETFELPDALFALCHSSSVRREANFNSTTSSATPQRTTRAVRRIIKGDELVMLAERKEAIAIENGAATMNPEAGENLSSNMAQLGATLTPTTEDGTSSDAKADVRGYKCHRCGKTFSYDYYRDKHLKYTRCVDNGDRKFRCQKCPRSFEKRDRLRIHILHVHENHRPHLCTTCGKAFSQSSSLNKHLRVHSGERPYRCAFCNRAFTASSILRTHMRQHSGEKPFKCAFCGKNFASHAAHDSHVRRTHAEGGGGQERKNKGDTRKSISSAISNHSTTSGASQTPLGNASGDGWKCLFCNKAFDKEVQMKFHMHLHL